MAPWRLPRQDFHLLANNSFSGRAVQCPIFLEWVLPERELPPKKREETVWAQIDKAFARPVTPRDDSADYVPTQVLAEFFRANGFDGIGYRSSLGAGHNIVLFDIDAVELTTRLLLELRSMNFEFREAVTPYFLRRQPHPKTANRRRQRTRARR
ncbi:MAG: hypothetical protein A2038_04775 [Deltaproteobacteria bacterium GWA2_57_13]|nr:MAG: hypothetical protein A2038_04775 [Deltaproteobacteria bacterium GWA2_57_13]